MNTWEEVMHQPYYSAETLRELTDGMTDYMKSEYPDGKSVFHFFVAAAHASDICETIRNKRKPDFDLLPYEDIEADIAQVFKMWRLRAMFFSEDEQGNAVADSMHFDLGGVMAVPISSEKMNEGQSQLEKKASCFFLFYFWNLFHQKIGDKYEMSFSVNSIMIPMLHDFAFSQLGINIKRKDGSAVQHYFDALKFGEDVCDKSDADIYFAIKETLNSFGIAELHVPASEKYDESRFKVYKDELIGYVPIGGETRVSIPEGIKSIKNGVFREIAGITTIDLPDSLEELKPTALCCMPDLIEVNVAHNLKYIDGFAFMDSKIVKECDSMLIIGGWLIKCNLNDTVIRIPENVVGICYTAFDDSEKVAKEIVLPPRIKIIYDETFDGFIQLEKINLPEGLQEIYPRAFSDCESLQEIIMPDTVTVLDEGAFQGCCSLKRVRLSDNITEIKEFTFVDCNSLEELHLPANLKSIGENGINAFAGCSSLKKIVFPDHLEYIGECAFQDCEELEEIVLPDSIKTIDNMAFAGCTNLKKVHLPNHEIDIAENAFEGTPWENEQ